MVALPTTILASISSHVGHKKTSCGSEISFKYVFDECSYHWTWSVFLCWSLYMIFANLGQGR